MLNADSSTLKSESELQSEEGAADDPERRRVLAGSLDDADDVVDRLRGEERLELGDEVARLVRAARKPRSASARKISGTNESSAK